MNRGKQSVKKGIWRIGGRYIYIYIYIYIYKKKGGAIPIGLIASLVVRY